MKKEIHPKYFDSSVISCVCGTAHKIGSTMEKIETEICSECHPFYTGKEKMADTAGRVDKFNKRRAAATKEKK